MVQIIRAQHLGFCFGVRDALTAAEQLDSPNETVMYGELVHNADVVRSLTQRGVEVLDEHNRTLVPERPNVLVTAHGISNHRRRELTSAGKHLIDTTCPLVRRVHDVTQALVDRGFYVVVLGMPDHVEVQGIVEDLPEGGWQVVSDEADIQPLKHFQLGIVCQTTMPEELALRCRERLTKLNPQATIRWINTICRPTKQRQSAVDQLCDQVQAVVIVGGANSNNTRRLTQRCIDQGCQAYQVESAAELRAEWFDTCERIGLTAGTSTPDEVIDQVETRLRLLTQDCRRTSRSTPLPADNAQWSEYFESNLRRDPRIPWSPCPTLTAEERESVARSIQVFQLGESGEGNHIRQCARDWILHQRGDAHYLTALNLFLGEENQHAAWLGRFLEQEGIPLLEQQWSDSCFRRLRHLAGLHTSISVLLTAEILAQVYYFALSRATQSPSLIALCKRVLRDERFHVIFQQRQRLELARHWSRPRRMAARLQDRALLEIAKRIVWHDHRSVFRAAKLDFASYQTRCHRRWQAAQNIRPHVLDQNEPRAISN